MKREVIINGKQSLLNDLPSAASIVEVEPGVFSVLLDGDSYLAQVTRNKSSFTVEIRGRLFEIETVDPRAPRRTVGLSGREGRQTIAAPMPGKIVSVLVREGDSVTRGQGIVVMEAMKMQNELKSPREGIVTALSAREGATVAAGEVLAAIE